MVPFELATDPLAGPALPVELDDPDDLLLGQATRAAPGRLTELVSDPDARTARIRRNATGAAADARLLVWVPDGGHGEPSIGGENVGDVEATATEGGWLVSAAVGCDYVLEGGGEVTGEVTGTTDPC